MGRIQLIGFIIFIVGSISFSQIHERLSSTGNYKVNEIPEGCKRSNKCSYEVAEVNGDKLFIVDSKDSQHYHPYEIRETTLFWLKRSGDYKKNEDWEDQLWKTDLKSLKSEKIVAAKGLDYRVSPDAKSVIYERDHEVFLKKVDDKKVLKIASQNEGGATEGFELITWSSDGKKFWLGTACNCPERWEKLGLYEDEKMRWFPYMGSYEGFLEPDRGWLISSTIPFHFDTDSKEEFEKSKQSNRLEVIDVYSGKRALVVESKSKKFEPKWIDPSTLEYTDSKKKKKISASEILRKMK